MEKRTLNRHDLVFVSQQGRQRMASAVLATCTGARRAMVAEVFSDQPLYRDIPGIVRRADETEVDGVPLGFVHPELLEETRLRIATAALWSEIERVETPFEVLQHPIVPRTSSLQLLQKIQQEFLPQGIELGVLGSLALEIITQLPYSNPDSDIDLLIRGASLDTIREVYGIIKEWGAEKAVDIDIEVALTNGYGVKATELFMETQTVLGKSLQDVCLLPRKLVLKVL